MIGSCSLGSLASYHDNRSSTTSLSSTALVKTRAQMSLLVLSGADVDGVVSSMTPDSLQLLMAQVFARLSASSKARAGGNIHMPARIVLPTENHTALFMPARIGRVAATTSDSAQENVTGSDMSILGTAVKVVCVPNESDPRGLPGTTLVLDEVTGAVKAVVNARKLTALRNAAGRFHCTFSCFPPSDAQLSGRVTFG
jgi:ornithine cyclodeaminase/alanine dehydrogenase-like protein (mu-crystallin family)